MRSPLPRTVVVAGAALGVLILIVIARTWPWYFDQKFIGGAILLEFLALAVWRFRQVFFPLLIVAFLWAGSGVPGAAIWTSARWGFLGVGAVVGLLILLKDRHLTFGTFHGIALFAVLASVVSAMVSRYPGVALLKALSLFLLFLYSASGAKLAILGREKRFTAGLVLGCELLVSFFVLCYLVLGNSIMGNPNSLGAITGVVVAPLLLWGALSATEVAARRRHYLMFAICVFLVFYSHSRASMVAAAFSCGLLCIGLRRYRALIVGVSVCVMFLATVALVQPEQFLEKASTVQSEFVYKGISENGVLASRRSGWQEAVDTIRAHFWFGTGFGTIDKGGQDATVQLGTYASVSQATSEYGSSYLKIATWVGMLGVLPFVLLLLMLAAKVIQTVKWMLKTGSPAHLSIPLAIVVAGGMLHAAFEDWMFAPGYYLCVFFWCMAFSLVDLAPVQAVVPAKPRLWRSSRPLRGGLRVPVPTR